MNVKRILSAALIAGMFLAGNFGCVEKPPAKSELKVTTPGGTKLTIEKPVEPASQNPPPANP